MDDSQDCGARLGRRVALLSSFLLLICAPLWPVGRAAVAAQGPEGNEICLGCHEEQAQVFAKTKMGWLTMSHPRNDIEREGCLSCHGDGSAHVQAGGLSADGLVTFKKGAEPVSVQNEACIRCHQGDRQSMWKGSKHQTSGLACGDCHEIMRPLPYQLKVARLRTEVGRKRPETEVCLGCHQKQRAQLLRSSHMPVREGKVTCTSCHNPHGTLGAALLEEATVNDTCYRCHAEKRGPHLWEHAPVQENCLTCHTPHGSIHPSLLVAKVPLLCQRCHAAAGHPSAALPAASRFAFNRGCSNCHAEIHGSNHPSGANLLR